MRYSLKHKATLLIIVLALVLSAASIIVSNKAISDIARSNYEKQAGNLARTTAAALDAEALGRLQAATDEILDSLKAEEKITSDDWGSDAFNEYIARFEALSETADYKKIHHQMRRIQDANDVDCVYTSYVDTDSQQLVYLVDAAEEDACPIGCLDPLYEQNQRLLEDPSIGFPTYTTDTEEYGSLATSGAPVYDKTGAVVGYGMVDVSMEDITSWRHKMLAILIGLQIAITAIVVIVSFMLVNRALVKPINQLSQAAKDYSQDEDVVSHDHFSKLDIHSHDEIKDLSESMKQMEEDLNDKVDNLLKTTNELTESRQEVSKMNEIALKDALTGVHSKYAYDSDMQALSQSSEKDFGLAVIDLNELKMINDTYGHEKGNIAIKEICRIVCYIFTHSPVYRIGGDEFVVMLKGHDLEHIEELVERFNNDLLEISKQEDLQPWERVSAAIGYAVFDPDRDETPEGTFRQADRAMYVRKQEMKSNT